MSASVPLGLPEENVTFMPLSLAVSKTTRQVRMVVEELEDGKVVSSREQIQKNSY